MKQIITLISIILIIGGCASASPITLPSGNQGFVVDCSGTAFNWSSCYEKAGEVCSGGYDILEKDEERVMIGTAPGINRLLVVACK
tara:strand:+ start:264 stop:521 length:258 start_codon:yes stop_codon:yes gene_type:complete